MYVAFGEVFVENNPAGVGAARRAVHSVQGSTGFDSDDVRYFLTEKNLAAYIKTFDDKMVDYHQASRYSSAPSLQECLSWQAKLAIKAGDLETAFSLVEKIDYQVSGQSSFRRGESNDLESVGTEKFFQPLAASFIESIKQSKVIENPEKQLARAYQLYGKSLSRDNTSRNTDYYGSSDIPLELEVCIRRLTREFKPDDLLAAARTAPKQIRDRYLEDWAVAMAPQDLEQVIKVLAVEYGKDMPAHPVYLKSFYGLLIGAVKPSDIGRLRQLLSEGSEIERYKIERYKNNALSLGSDPRLARHPAIALASLDPDRPQGMDTSEWEPQAEAVLIARLYRADPLAAGQRAMEFFDRHTYGDHVILSAAAKFSPEHALILLEYHTLQTFNERNSWVVVKGALPDRLGPLLVLAESRGRKQIFDGLLKAVASADETIRAAAPSLHLLKDQSRTEFMRYLVPEFSSWAWRNEPKSPLPTFRSLATAEPWVRQNYCQNLRYRLMDRAFDGYRREQEGKITNESESEAKRLEIQTIYQWDTVENTLSDPRWLDLEGLYGQASDDLVDVALMRPRETEEIIGAALRIRQNDPALISTDIISALKDPKNPPAEIIAALNDPRFESLEILKNVRVRASCKKELLSSAGRQTIFSLIESKEIAAAAAVVKDRFPDLLNKFIEYYKSADPEVQAGFRALVGSPEFKKLYESLPAYRDTLFTRVVREPDEIKRLFSRLRTADSKVAFIFELAAFDPNALTHVLEVISPEEMEEAAEVIVKRRLPWEVLLKLPLAWPQRKKFLEQRAAGLEGEFPGSAVMRKSLERSLRSEESFDGNSEHLLKMQNRLSSLAGSIPSSSHENLDLMLNRVLGAQEMVANKNLRNRLEKLLFDSPVSDSVLADLHSLADKTPDRMAASLGLLAERPLELPHDAIVRLGATMFEGKALKKQTDVDRFNYFLLEGAEKNSGQAMRAFFDQAIPLMERTPNAKRLIFELSQIMRSFGAVEGSFGDRLSGLNAELKQVAGLIEAAPQFKNPADTAKFVARIDKQILAGLQEQVDGLSQRLVESFQAKAGVALSKEETVKFLESFDNPSLIFIYLGKLSAYPHQLGLYRQFIESVAKGGFPDIRYSLNRDHLDKVFAGQPQKEAAWRENLNLTKVAQQENSPAAALHQRISDIMGGALDDHHLPDAAWRLVKEFADANSEERALILARTRSEISNLNLLVRLATPETDDKVKKMKEGIKKKLSLEKQQELALTELVYSASGTLPLEESLNQAEASFKLMLLLDAKPEHLASGRIEISKEGGKKQSLELKDLLREVREREAKAEVFINDLAGIENAIMHSEAGEGAVTTSGKLLVEESEDPDLMLRLGTDVDSSCQNVNGTPDHNRNLVSYIMDGKTKVLLVRDADGAIVSRSIMRLLYDETAKTPVIHLERDYHRSGAPIEISNRLLMDLAKAKAKQCQFPLVVSGRFNAKDNLTQYENPITSYGGPGDTEYSDNLSGSQPGQKYTIPPNNISLVVL